MWPTLDGSWNHILFQKKTFFMSVLSCKCSHYMLYFFLNYCFSQWILALHIYLAPLYTHPMVCVSTAFYSKVLKISFIANHILFTRIMSLSRHEEMFCRHFLSFVWGLWQLSCNSSSLRVSKSDTVCSKFEIELKSKVISPFSIRQWS